MRRSAVPLRIKRVISGSPSDRAGIQAGSHLLKINHHRIRDILDYQFYSADPDLDCVFLQKGKDIPVRLTLGNRQDPGLEFEPMKFACCGNRCLFCFLDQNPKNMRESLYFKDEDYRLSFLFGNYVTLTRVKEEDLRRIVGQKLSPLYVSVHAFDPEVRKKLLGIKKDDRLWEKLRFLIGHGIELHGQIVLCPGINDGEVLDKTIEACSQYYPGFRSLAVVPVGLTRHRKNLFPLIGYDKITARVIVKQTQTKQGAFQRKFGEAFVYLADEFYLLSGTDFPFPEHYGDFWQSENGVGMTVRIIEAFHASARAFPQKLDSPLAVVLVTGAMAGPVLAEHVLPALNRIRNLKAEVCVVPNRFYGESVTVSGLLTGGDILDALAAAPRNAVVFLPSNCLNSDGLFLDNWTVSGLSEKAGKKIKVADSFESVRESL